MKNFKIQWKALTEWNTENAPEVPKIPKAKLSRLPELVHWKQYHTTLLYNQIFNTPCGIPPLRMNLA